MIASSLQISVQLQPGFVLILLIIIALLAAAVAWLVLERRVRVSIERAQRLQHLPRTERSSLAVPTTADSVREEERNSHALTAATLSSSDLLHVRYDNPLSDKRWLKLVEECVELFDDLDRRLADFDAPSQALAEHVLLQLQEILERSDVEVIDNDSVFERQRHQPERSDLQSAPGTPIVKILSPGFAIGRRVLRRAHVRLTAGHSDESDTT